jgi:tripartite-type tricarboxylate transporter receptor subunit TctC
MDRRHFIGLAASGVLGVVGPGGKAWAQDWPQRLVKFIVPLGPGSALDIAARVVADRLSVIWQQPVVVENRPGGDGIVAISAFVGARDDHVLLFAPSGIFTPHPFVHEQLPYDAKRDLIPIAGISDVSVCIAIPQALNVNSLAELIALARKEPGKLNWAAITSLDDFVFSGFIKGEGLSMSRVPYRDPVSALNDLSEGRVDTAVTSLALALPRVQAGKVKLLALVNPRRSIVAPDLPTVAELGYPTLGMDPIIGPFGSSVISPAVRQKIADDLKTIAADASLQSSLTPTGQVVAFVSTADFEASIDAERAKVAAIAKMIGGRPGQ